MTWIGKAFKANSKLLLVVLRQYFAIELVAIGGGLAILFTCFKIVDLLLNVHVHSAIVILVASIVAVIMLFFLIVLILTVYDIVTKEKKEECSETKEVNCDK